MEYKNRNLAIIGSGISGLSAACYAAKKGYKVKIFEKNETIGGRARQFRTENGYTFDMGPSWYWMPDVIEEFFNDFGYKTSDFYELVSLDPQFEIIFKDQSISFPESFDDAIKLFESLEPGAGKKLIDFMDDAKIKYDIGMKDFVTRPCLSITEFLTPKIAQQSLKLNLFTNYRDFVAKYFRHPYLQQIMEFPVIFLGASPKNIPALYSLMNYGGYKMGTWYPMGGFYKLIEAMEKIAINLGVEINTNSGVTKINTKDRKANSIEVNNETLYFDHIIASSDYHHTENLLSTEDRNYNEDYWSKKTFAPSCLIFYLGFNEKIDNLKHHTLFFENDLDDHVDEIYETKKWPKAPLFYTCCPSKTDNGIAPKDHENVFLLMPIAINIEDSQEVREYYFLEMIKRLEKKTGAKNLIEKIDYKRSYCIEDFKNDYNAYGGNAYGLANTLKQTAILKPKIKNKKIQNLHYTGQLTVPGPGVPPSIISGKIVADQLR